MGCFPTPFYNWANLATNIVVFPGVPDDFGGGPTTLHSDPGPPLHPLQGPGKGERAQETPRSCGRKKYSMAGTTTLTNLSGTVPSHPQNKELMEQTTVLNCIISPPHCTIFPTREQEREVLSSVQLHASVSKVFWYRNPQYNIPSNPHRRNTLTYLESQTFHWQHFTSI